MPITRHDSPASGATGKIAKTKIKPIRKPDFRRQHPREKKCRSSAIYTILQFLIRVQRLLSRVLDIISRGKRKYHFNFQGETCEAVR
jgi:hypothetical protein